VLREFLCFKLLYWSSELRQRENYTVSPESESIVNFVGLGRSFDVVHMMSQLSKGLY